MSCKGKTVADMIGAVNAFKAKMNIFSVQLDKAAEKYSQVINRLWKEFENRSFDFDQLEPCVSFISNPFMRLDILCIAEQLSAMFWTQKSTKVYAQQL